jgi:hypothetical protein
MKAPCWMHHLGGTVHLLYPGVREKRPAGLYNPVRTTEFRKIRSPDKEIIIAMQQPELSPARPVVVDAGISARYLA